MSAPTKRAVQAVPEPRRQRWPGLDTVPQSPARARIAQALFRAAVSRIDVRVSLPDGRTLGRGGPDAPLMRLVRPDRFFARLGSDSKIGFGEAYMTGDWEAEDLPAVLTAFARKLTSPVPVRLQPLRRLLDPRLPASEENTLRGARQNIHRHYDLSNELFALFLDETMTYSCAWYEHPEQELKDAQIRKIDAMLDMARVSSGTRLLEIGTGWGALAIRAARERGAQVTSLTISVEQQRLAQERIAAAGASDRIEVLIRDYREAEGSYDAIVSVEMLEAVGEQYWPAYFGAVDRLLAPGGWAAVQTITMPHHRLQVSRNSYTWMHKYVFPGGLMPSIEAIEQTLEQNTTLRITERRDMGLDYARTLAQWRANFLARADDVLALGFDTTFIRMWEYYLAYCQAGFATRYIDDSQIGLSREH
jgi:cyclopropane-fatty-acyl-phospholipid synthase